MMIARIKKSVGPDLLLIGLSRANVEKMMAGQPVHITEERHHHGIADLEIDIMFGENEKAMYEQLKHEMTPETKINLDPRVMDPRVME